VVVNGRWWRSADAAVVALVALPVAPVQPAGGQQAQLPCRPGLEELLAAGVALHEVGVDAGLEGRQLAAPRAVLQLRRTTGNVLLFHPEPPRDALQDDELVPDQRPLPPGPRMYLSRRLCRAHACFQSSCRVRGQGGLARQALERFHSMQTSTRIGSLTCVVQVVIEDRSWRAAVLREVGFQDPELRTGMAAVSICLLLVSKQFGSRLRWSAAPPVSCLHGRSWLACRSERQPPVWSRLSLRAVAKDQLFAGGGGGGGGGCVSCDVDCQHHATPP
jgi:hypothetical protein